MKNHFSLVFWLTAFAFFSCDSGRKKHDDPPLPNRRAGRALVKTETKYIDFRPSISAAGNRLSFISGRDEGVLRTFVADFSGDEGSQNLRRLSTTLDLSEETYAELSPDGNWVLVQGMRNDKNLLLLVNAAGTSATTFSEQLAGSKLFAVSPDSKLVAFVEQVDSSTQRITIADVATTLATSTLAGTTESISSLGLSLSGSTYTLSYQSENPGTAEKFLRTYSGTSRAALAAATSKALLSSDNLSTTPVSCSGQEQFAMASPNTDVQALRMLPAGGGAPGELYFLRRELRFFSYAAGELQGRLGPLFVDVSSCSAAAQFAVGTVTGTLPVSCAAQAAPQLVVFGQTMGVFNSLGAAGKHLFLQRQDDASWKLVAEPCVGEAAINSKVDLTIEDAKVNLNGTAENFYAVFVSQFGKDARTLGDPEVRLIRRGGGDTWKVYEISANAMP